jgi:hypothetical protein
MAKDWSGRRFGPHRAHRSMQSLPRGPGANESRPADEPQRF